MSEESSLIQSRKKRKSNCGEPSANVIKHSQFHCAMINIPWDLSPMQQLHAFLDAYSKQPVDPWEYGTLMIQFVVIKRSMITLLRPLLHYCDEASSSYDNNNITSNTQNKFSSVRFFSSWVLSEGDDVVARRTHRNAVPDHDICTHNDKVCFFSALARCSRELEITSSDEIVSALLNIPEIDHLEAEILKIEQRRSLTHLEYARLDTILRNSVKLTELILNLPFKDLPQSFCDNFASCIHIQSLRITLNDKTDDISDAFLSGMVANERRNGAIERLLRNPQNQMKKLDLSSTSLEDYHVMVIAQLLPTSHVEEIDLSYNYIEAPGLLEFARQLPKMHSLTKLSFGGNPWEESSLEVIAECGSALFHGLMENPTMQCLDSMDKFPHYRLLWECGLLKNSGGDILTSLQERPIPDGLWPYVLSLAGRPKKNGGRVKHGSINAMYFFLQDCPERFSSYIR